MAKLRNSLRARNVPVFVDRKTSERAESEVGVRCPECGRKYLTHFFTADQHGRARWVQRPAGLCMPCRLSQIRRLRMTTSGPLDDAELWGERLAEALR